MPQARHIVVCPTISLYEGRSAMNVGEDPREPQKAVHVVASVLYVFVFSLLHMHKECDRKAGLRRVCL